MVPFKAERLVSKRRIIIGIAFCIAISVAARIIYFFHYDFFLWRFELPALLLNTLKAVHVAIVVFEQHRLPLYRNEKREKLLTELTIAITGIKVSYLVLVLTVQGIDFMYLFFDISVVHPSDLRSVVAKDDTGNENTYGDLSYLHYC
jgi:hypothetical protein